MSSDEKLVRPANDKDRKRALNGHFLRARIKQESVVRVITVPFGIFTINS